MDIPDFTNPEWDWTETKRWFKKVNPDDADPMAMAWLKLNNATQEKWPVVHTLCAQNPEKFRSFVAAYRLGAYDAPRG